MRLNFLALNVFLSWIIDCVRFTPVLGGLSANDIIQRATDRLDTMHSECIHVQIWRGTISFCCPHVVPHHWFIAFQMQRLSELCCSAVSQLLILGKSVISSANRGKNGETEGETPKIDWPEEAVSKAKIIRHKAQSMSGNMETVSNSFITGVLDDWVKWIVYFTYLCFL